MEFDLPVEHTRDCLLWSVMKWYHIMILWKILSTSKKFQVRSNCHYEYKMWSLLQKMKKKKMLSFWLISILAHFFSTKRISKLYFVQNYWFCLWLRNDKLPKPDSWLFIHFFVFFFSKIIFLYQSYKFNQWLPFHVLKE